MSFDNYKEKGGRYESAMSYEKKMTIKDVEENSVVMEIEERQISKKTAEYFGIRTGLDVADGITPVAYYFPAYIDGKLCGYKKKDLTIAKGLDRHFTAIEYAGPKCDMFGMNVHRKNGEPKKANATGGKKIIITEGELDCAIVWQSMKDKNPGSHPAVTSIAAGTASAVQNLGQKQNLKHIGKFKETVAAFDNDAASPQEKVKGVMKGVEATNAVYGLLPELLVAKIPVDMDPCDMYSELGSEALYWAVVMPAPYIPEGFVIYDDELREKAISMPTLGKPWPWKTVTRKTLGRRLGEGIYIGSGVKMGKSELANKLIEHIVKTEYNAMGDPQRAAVFKFEETPEETIKKVAGKFYRKDFVNPEKIIFIGEDGTELAGKEIDVWGDVIRDNSTYFTQEDLIAAVDDIGPRLITYNNYGRCNWSELKGAIRHAVLVEGVQDIFIDPITRLTSGMSASDANTELETFADEISKMSIDLGFTYYCFVHLKAPPHPGKPHEFGGRIFSNQFRGSRAMMQNCHYTMGLEGNKDVDENEKVRNTRYLVCLDDRKYGRTFRIPLFYNVETGDFQEPPEGFLEDDECMTLAEWDAKQERLQNGVGDPMPDLGNVLESPKGDTPGDSTPPPWETPKDDKLPF